MAKYGVTYSCGHKGEVELFGPSKDREDKIKWREAYGLCPNCWKTKCENDRATENAKAAAIAADNNLPPLIGTEKQVAWAMTLRQKVLDRLDNLKPDERTKNVRDYIIATKKDAAEYINYRDNLDNFIRMVCREIKDKRPDII